jgi:GNAT superfamily N-acetyltransferase
MQDTSYSETRTQIKLLVRAASPSDVSALAAHFSAMQTHYGRPVSDGQARDAAVLACRPPTATFDPHVLLAFSGGRIAGSMVLNVSFPAFELSRSLYIRDLYVARDMRRHGVGRALIKAGACLALEHGFSALEWTTDAGNFAARQMYTSCGARLLERTYFRIFDDELRDAAAL